MESMARFLSSVTAAGMKQQEENVIVVFLIGCFNSLHLREASASDLVNLRLTIRYQFSVSKNSLIKILYCKVTSGDRHIIR